MRSAPPQFFRELRQICDEHGLLLAFDEVQTGIGRLGEMFGYQKIGVTPDVMALAKGLGAGFPIGAVLATDEAAKGMTPGTHGSTFGGNPLAVAVGNAVLDVVTKPGFLDHVRSIALLFKQRLAEIKDRHPSVIAEVRGEGLLIGLKCEVPNSELIDAFRAEKLLAVGAGDNVARLVPPLIVTEAEVADAIARVDRACAAIERARAGGAKAGSGRVSTERHPPFPRSDRHSAQATARDDRDEPRHEKGGARSAAGKGPLAGKTIAMIFDKPSTRTRVSFDVGIRQLGGESITLTGQEMQLGRGETIADTARVLSRYVDAIVIRTLDHDQVRGAGRHRHRAGDQRPDQAVASVPGDGRRDDLRGASRRDQGPHRGLDRRRQQRAGVLDACRRPVRLRAPGGDAAGAQPQKWLLDWVKTVRRGDQRSATIRRRR